MRVPKQVMAENNSRIITEAARLFREKGVENTSVADVMGAAGLTHGGFYRHFQSKDELVDVAIKKVFKESIDSLEAKLNQGDAEQVISHFIQQYLSIEHVNEPANGCPVAALGAEGNRKPIVLKSALAKGAERMVNLLAQNLEGDPSEAHEKATGLLAVLVGSVVLARSAKTKQMQSHILSSGIRLAELCVVGNCRSLDPI